VEHAAEEDDVPGELSGHRLPSLARAAPGPPLRDDILENPLRPESASRFSSHPGGQAPGQTTGPISAYHIAD
jgi:hypothetical protein